MKERKFTQEGDEGHMEINPQMTQLTQKKKVSHKEAHEEK